VGWKLGLDRIRRLVSVLGMPQHRFASIHVVGTNGKSSVAETTMRLLSAHGMRAGAYVSPHLERWSERVLVDGEETAPEAFAAAVGRVAESAEAVNRSLADGEEVTQFEVATAAAFVALAAADVEVAVIEAGLGGRLDATNVIPSRATALTSVGLEHTEWLGSTLSEIAVEKLAVLRDHSTLVLGELYPEVERLAREVAAERHAEVVAARPSPAVRPRARGAYQRRNFAVSLAAAEAMLGRLDPKAALGVAAELELAGRMEVVAGDPPLVLDVAHNPDGARALAEALPEATAGAPVVACVAVLEGKDAAGIAEALAPGLDGAVCTALQPEDLTGLGRPGAASTPAAVMSAHFARAGVASEAVDDPDAAIARTEELARERSGTALVTGSHYLLRRIVRR
jgi:dihydrofolate synthase / folylpolyglutamate synthase